MLATAMLLGWLVVASYTDFRWRVISNRTTYSGIISALVGAAITSLVGIELSDWWWGFLSFPAALGGFVTSGFLMLVCYLFFPGGVGGGDVKLMAMIGAFLGIQLGLEALLWTFVIAACTALSVLVWRNGFVQLLRKFFGYFWAAAKMGVRPEVSEHDKQALATELFLSPSALAAVVIARWALL